MEELIVLVDLAFILAYIIGIYYIAMSGGPDVIRTIVSMLAFGVVILGFYLLYSLIFS